MPERMTPEVFGYWTALEIASHFRVAPMTVYRMMKSGELPAVRIGKQYRVSDQDLNAYIAKSLTSRPQEK